MSHAPYPPPPPSPGPGFGPPAARRPANGVAVAALVVGIIALVTSPIPLVNFVGLLLALVGVCLGVVGLVRGRRTGRRTALAGWGLGLSVVAAGVAVVVGFLTLRYLGDWLDTVDPPEPSAQVGEWFTTDDGDLRIKVTTLECHAYDPEYATGPSDVECTFAFVAQNRSERAISLNDVTVKSVIDGAWDSADVSDPALGDEYQSSVVLEAGEEKSLAGDITPRTGHLDGIVFDADDASSHSAIVVDAGEASSGQ
ncbi:hypothetical protein [Nocardioides daeguensis]|uniref:DUF4352 domain-containing protein n=1 Tax=Nocardioides daeguensis TaxID=908359 RepID=A0ABP6W225_9ACTN|nr:hypothetical protein [Nocardioides daeguensis]MBV6726761.1 hypothetical protein [Nocardioides daeguensis]MCR1774487.1 hypothetical protein [Nocardioides daeguensis]